MKGPVRNTFPHCSKACSYPYHLIRGGRERAEACSPLFSSVAFAVTSFFK